MRMKGKNQSKVKNQDNRMEEKKTEKDCNEKDQVCGLKQVW